MQECDNSRGLDGKYRNYSRYLGLTKQNSDKNPGGLSQRKASCIQQWCACEKLTVWIRTKECRAFTEITMMHQWPHLSDSSNTAYFFASAAAALIEASLFAAAAPTISFSLAALPTRSLR